MSKTTTTILCQRNYSLIPKACKNQSYIIWVWVVYGLLIVYLVVGLVVIQVLILDEAVCLSLHTATGASHKSMFTPVLYTRTIANTGSLASVFHLQSWVKIWSVIETGFHAPIGTTVYSGSRPVTRRGKEVSRAR